MIHDGQENNPGLSAPRRKRRISQFSHWCRPLVSKLVIHVPSREECQPATIEARCMDRSELPGQQKGLWGPFELTRIESVKADGRWQILSSDKSCRFLGEKNFPVPRTEMFSNQAMRDLRTASGRCCNQANATPIAMPIPGPFKVWYLQLDSGSGP